MKRQILGTTLSLSLCLAAGTAVPSGAAVQQQRDDARGLCRRAAPLPPLPPEGRVRREQQNYRRGEPIPAPPAMMAPEPMPSPPSPP
ncbi:MAG TPA: hypothetical protein VLK25_02580, partial [Allosphingosinicella sp.]|nr:hypothetical protein [Allosphingosinicella sp.]